MIAGSVEPDCRPDGFEESVDLAARGKCILIPKRDLPFPQASGCSVFEGLQHSLRVTVVPVVPINHQAGWIFIFRIRHEGIESEQDDRRCWCGLVREIKELVKMHVSAIGLR